MGAAIIENQHRPKEGDKKEHENELKGRLGFVVEEGNELKAYRAAPNKVCCPMQAEVKALRDAVLFVKGLGILSCTFYTDNQSLANLCSALHPSFNAEWKAYKEINDV